MKNEVLKVLEERRSCRNFQSRPVDDSDIESIVRAGTYAPSGLGKQSPVIIVIKDKTMRDRLVVENRKIAGLGDDFDPFYGAPVILLVLALRDVPTYCYDGSLVLGNMLNAAESLGLGSIWIHRAKEEMESDFGKELLDSLGIKGDYEGIGHCAIGYWNGYKPKGLPRKKDYIYYI